MSAIEEAVASGERSIAAFIENANALSQQISASFPPMTLDEVHAKFAAQPIPENAKPGLNPEVSKLWSLVRHHAALAVDEFRNAEQWLAMKAPSVSDGNNFGVDVQNFVGAECAASAFRRLPVCRAAACPLALAGWLACAPSCKQCLKG